MHPSMFNLRVPIASRNEVFLMNTLTDAQMLVAPEVVDLMDRLGAAPAPPLASVSMSRRST